MRERCEECGAVLPEGNTCQSIFEQFLRLEYSDPAYYKAHFPMVTTFMIQHGRYSDEALAWARSNLCAYLAGNLTVAQIRQHARKDTSSTTRTWKVTRQPGARPLPPVAWSMTIADVARQYENAESYIRLVRQWADMTCKESVALLPGG
jgi:hypothetical protein